MKLYNEFIVFIVKEAMQKNYSGIVKATQDQEETKIRSPTEK